MTVSRSLRDYLVERVGIRPERITTICNGVDTDRFCPAERMAVIGGRRIGRSITLGPAFDVTSDGPETSRGHVHADPDRLRAALLALELVLRHTAFRRAT